MTDRKLDAIAAEAAAMQYGVIERRQLTDGHDRRAIDRRVEWGQLVRLASGVLAPASAVKDWRHDLSAALLAHPGSVISHASAAALHRWTGFPEGPVELSGSYTANTRSLGTVHRTEDLIPADLTEVDGLPVTTPVRTAIDMAAELRKGRLEWMLDDLLAARAFTLAQLEEAFARITRRGKPGMANLRKFLERRGPGYVPPMSRLEAKLIEVLEPLGPPYPVRQHPLPNRVGPGWVDLSYVNALYIVEGDGRRWHQREANMENDRWRDNEAAALGWLTSRFTWHMLTSDPEWVRGIVADVLRTRCR